MTTTSPRLIIHIVGPLLLNAEVFMLHVNNLHSPMVLPRRPAATCSLSALITSDRSQSGSNNTQARLKYAEDGDGMPTFSCPVLVLVQPIHSEGGEAHAELIVVATDFWRPSFSAAVTEYEVVTAPQSHRCSILTSLCPG